MDTGKKREEGGNEETREDGVEEAMIEINLEEYKC